MSVTMYHCCHALLKDMFPEGLLSISFDILVCMLYMCIACLCYAHAYLIQYKKQLCSLLCLFRGAILFRAIPFVPDRTQRLFHFLRKSEVLF